MRGLYSSKTEIRHKIFTEIARMAYEGQSPEIGACSVTFLSDIPIEHPECSMCIHNAIQQIALQGKILY